jgi:hypothetical protein
MSPDRVFHLELPRVDRFVRLLFTASHYNPDFGTVAYLLRREPAAEYLWLHNATPLIPKPTTTIVDDGPQP